MDKINTMITDLYKISGNLFEQLWTERNPVHREEILQSIGEVQTAIFALKDARGHYVTQAMRRGDDK